MIMIRKSTERGHAMHGWLESRHTFSFADYHDPVHMGFGALRVINEDRVAPGKGFASHSHRDMEIVSYVLEGALEHRDSMGNGSVIHPGDVQLMRAGTGVTHSEYNHSSNDPVHFLQIWIQSERDNLEPAYEQLHFPLEERRNVLRCVASPDGRKSSLRLHQDVTIHATVLETGKTTTHALALGRQAWLQMARGRAYINGVEVAQGDGVAVRDESGVEIRAESPSEILLFDLA
ncbi:MAG: pirin family protein [Candidatus Binatia bacterium]